ncbi:MAG TPA: ParB/RepB/Spo0J family partition protein [Thermoanaerobaculaceae bacterium]|nr:ParB/RepB/Spo0J family partition protein [Thermoanaerobaculaceae bacterium]
MSSRRGLPEARRMRHDRHFVEELANQSVIGVGLMVPLDHIETNREQPRSSLGDLTELVASIIARGVLEPLLVRRQTGGNTYQLIAGERRFHAAIEAGLVEVPCVELSATDQEALEIALVENLQRKDLTAFEEAEGYRALVEKYQYTHEQVAQAVGKSRPTISEALSLLRVPPAIRDLCRHADITAKSVLLLIARAETIAEMERLVEQIAEQDLDRDAARAAARQPAADRVPGSQEANTPRFKPVSLRFRQTGAAPVHLSLSIRQPGVSRDEIISTLEALLDQLRNGELDEKLQELLHRPVPGE